MNEPPTRMGTPGLRGSTDPPLSNCPRSLGRGRSVPREVGRGSPLAWGALNPRAVVAAAARAGGGRDNHHQDCAAGENLDSLSRVREKVLFLLHPDRGLGTPGDPTREEAAGGEDGSQAGGDDWECPSPHPPREERISGSGVDAHSGARRRDTGAPEKSVLVRVMDYQVTQEVLCTEWTKGYMTSRTEERCMTMVTFRTNKE